MKLEGWKRAHLLVLEIYKISKKLPDSERDGLAADVCAAVVAIPANIARGCAVREESDFREFLGVALESVRDVESNLLLMRDLGYLSASEHDRLEAMTTEVKSMLLKQVSNRRIASSSGA